MYSIFKRKDNVEYFVKFEGGLPRFTLHADEATRLTYDEALKELDIIRGITHEYKSFSMKIMRDEK
jgi:hypothetical protein